MKKLVRWLESVLLVDALRYSERKTLAFVGAGGKTTAMFKAARELLDARELEENNKTVLVTTTTHIGTWQAGLANHIYCIKSTTDITKLEKDLPYGIVLLTGEETNNRLGGLAPENLEKVKRIADDHQLPLLIEADGSHFCPLKAPATHEPAIPEFAQHVIVMAGLMGLGKPLTKNWVHRPEIFAGLSGLKLGEDVTSEALVKVLRNRDGGLKNIPSNASRSVLLNQADTEELQSQGNEISDQLIPDFHSIIIASLLKENNVLAAHMDIKSDRQGEIYAVIEQVAGVILAAGGSSRFGKPKQLLLWKGQPLIRHVVVAALKAGLSPVIVVVGSSSEEVGSAISDLPVRIVNNGDWRAGMSSSIRAGVAALPKEIGGAIFLPADQPQVSHVLIKSLVEAHQAKLGPITAPQINGQRGNPVLFDFKTFPSLLSLKEDMGGRALFSFFPVQWVTWHDPGQLMDIDTPEEYQKFLEIYPENEVKT